MHKIIFTLAKTMLTMQGEQRTDLFGVCLFVFCFWGDWNTLLDDNMRKKEV